MELLGDIFLALVGIIFIVLFLAWLGLQFKPKAFSAYPGIAPELSSVTLPAGLPKAVEHFYQTVYGEKFRSLKRLSFKEARLFVHS